MVEQAEKMKQEDEKKRKMIEMKNDADSLIYNTEKNIKEHGEKLTQQLKDDITACIGQLRTDLDAENEDGIKENLEKLRNLSLEIGKIMY